MFTMSSVEQLNHSVEISARSWRDGAAPWLPPSVTSANLEGTSPGVPRLTLRVGRRFSCIILVVIRGCLTLSTRQLHAVIVFEGELTAGLVLESWQGRALERGTLNLDTTAVAAFRSQ
jgi:hypothetical protein